MVSSLDVAWAAGFLEGEGTFRFTKSRSVCVSAPQKGTECLLRLQKLFGGSIYGPYTETHRIPQWQLTGNKAVGVMMTVYSFMSEKRKGEIKKAINIWKSIPLNSFTHIAVFGKCLKGHDWIPENIIIEYKNGKEHRRCRLCHNQLAATRPKYLQDYYLIHKDKIKARTKMWKQNHKLDNLNKEVTV